MNSVTGVITSGAAISAAVSAAILGHAGDRLGRRGVLVGCGIAACLSSLGHYVASDLPTLFVARIVFGFSVAGMMPAANAMINEVIDSRSIGKAYGLATSLSMLGAAVGPSVGGALAMQTGLRVPFLVTAAAQLSLVFAVLWFLRSRGSGKGQTTGEDRKIGKG